MWEHSDNNQSLKELSKIKVTGRKWQWHLWLDSSGWTPWFLTMFILESLPTVASVNFHNGMKEISWLPNCLFFHSYEIHFVHYIRTVTWNWMSDVEIVYFIRILWSWHCIDRKLTLLENITNFTAICFHYLWLAFKMRISEVNVIEIFRILLSYVQLFCTFALTPLLSDLG